MNILMLLVCLVSFSPNDLDNLDNWKPIATEWVDEDTVVCVLTNPAEKPSCIVVLANKQQGIILYGYEGGSDGILIFDKDGIEITGLPRNLVYTLKKFLFGNYRRA